MAGAQPLLTSLMFCYWWMSSKSTREVGSGNGKASEVTMQKLNTSTGDVQLVSRGAFVC